jgi:hypothetical protein
MFLRLLVCGLATASATDASVFQVHNAGMDAASQIASLGLPSNDTTIGVEFEKVYNSFLSSFDVDAYTQLLADLEKVGFKNFQTSKAFTAYRTVPGQAHCDRGTISPAVINALSTKGISPFPGGSISRVFGFDLGKMLFKIAEKARGPASATGGMAAILAAQGLAQGAGLLQSIVATAAAVVPPMVPPPAWNNQPLTCMPMVTGHNCFGAVLYPITMADFVMADVTDATLDGYIAGFPNTYATKVGKTSDAQYKLCFASAMSMMCGSLFPRCAAPQSHNDMNPVTGRVPMCFMSCISTLVMCPGFWLEDVVAPCSTVSAPPMCSQAVFFNMWRLPPQYSTYEDSHPVPLACPKAAASLGDAGADYGLYGSDASSALQDSPILRAAASEGSSAP